MNATLTVQSVDLSGVEDKLRSMKGYVEQRMADTFMEAVLSNFGGAERFVRKPFPPLSPSYAAKVGRSYATLEVSGKLKGAVGVGMDEDGSATVEVGNAEVPYATIHQYGGKNIPVRPYFPVDPDGTILPEVVELVNERAREEVARMLSQ